MTFAKIPGPTKRWLCIETGEQMSAAQASKIATPDSEWLYWPLPECPGPKLTAIPHECAYHPPTWVNDRGEVVGVGWSLGGVA